MSDDLAVINRAIAEHHNIKGHVKLVGDSVADLEALFTLETKRLELTVGSTEEMVQKQRELQQTMSFLEEGLSNHFGFEQKAFPALFGELLMRALLLEHREIRDRIEEAKSLVFRVRLEELSREELAAKKAEIKEAIDGVLQAVEAHAAKEETVLKMLKVALEDRESKKA